uniref:Uncharacterized protein n=1 Tax=Amphimedon queenslandica TaxID=400682 RepID=A0A1X7TD56_AMPQE
LHATCGVSNVTVRLNCSGSISYQVITDTITDIINRSSVSISINNTYCWDQCRISISYSNDAGKSKWSNTLTLANWTSLDNYGFVQDNVNFTIMNSSFIRMNWELTDTMECLSSRRLYDYVKIQWIPEECSQKTSDPNYWEYKGSFTISLRDEFYMIDVGDSGHDHYCIRASFCGANLPCTESYVYDVNVFNRAGSTSSLSPSPSPTVTVSSSSASFYSRNKKFFIIVGGVVGGCILLAVFITCFTCCYCCCRKQKRKREQQQQRLITQVHEHEEQTVKLLDDEEESVTSEKTIVQSLMPNKPYDEERMKKYLDDQYRSRQYLRDIEEGEDHTELEPGDKEEQRPNGQQPPPPLFSIRTILEKFPIDSQLQTRFEDYVDDVRRFILSANVSDLKNKVSATFGQKESAIHNSKVILKLSQKWSEQSINNLRKLTQYFFGEKADSLTYDHKKNSDLVQMANNQAAFMHHFGILQLIIDNKTIIDKAEHVKFEFELSLCDSIQIDINYQNEHGSTPLMFASHHGHHQVVELLLSKDPDINIQNNKGWNALIFASYYGHHQVVELLLSKDPDINIQSNDGWNALMHASSSGHHQVVKLLDPDAPDEDSYYSYAIPSSNHPQEYSVCNFS